MVDTTSPGIQGQQNNGGLRYRYSRASISYSSTFQNPVLQKVISAMEWLTGKITILRWVYEFEKRPRPTDHRFFREALDVMGINVITPEDQVAKIPAKGPVVIVANHPHGMIDGMVMADLIGKVRADYKVLTRSLLVDLDDVAGKYMISVPFPHDEDAQRKGVQMRGEAMKLLRDGGVVALFPSGVVASADEMFGPAVEREWNVFTAQLIQRSGATVVPVKFHGQNSRWYHIANKISATLRQGLLIHEIANQKGKDQAPTVGDAITPRDCAEWKSDPRGFMAWLRERTLSLR